MKEFSSCFGFSDPSKLRAKVSDPFSYAKIAGSVRSCCISSSVIAKNDFLFGMSVYSKKRFSKISLGEVSQASSE